MKIEEMFKNGITPKEGANAGKRFKVIAIDPEIVNVALWDNPDVTAEFQHGTYEMWQPPKTLFKDHSIAPTLGNLKLGIEQERLSDDIVMYYEDSFGFLRQADFHIARNSDDKKIIVIN